MLKGCLLLASVLQGMTPVTISYRTWKEHQQAAVGGIGPTPIYRPTSLTGETLVEISSSSSSSMHPIT